MNRKLTILLIAAVATILPAVAVADVLVTGNLTIQSGTNTNLFYFQQGPNYLKAHAAGAITWIEPVSSTNQGTIDLEGIGNQSTYMVNVLDMNFSLSPTAIPPPFVLYLNFSNSNFPAGTVMVVSTSQLTITQLQSTPVTQYSGTSIVVNGGLSSTVVAVDLSQNPSLVVTNFGHSTTLYFGFELPPGLYTGASADLTGTFVAT